MSMCVRSLVSLLDVPPVRCISASERVHCVPVRTCHMLGHMLLNDAVSEMRLPWQPLMYTKSYYLRVERSLMRLVFGPTSVHLVPWKVLSSSPASIL